jgi:cell pole-organizing protein PopZ
MGALTNEPSMEEILSSIKRIIAEDDGAPQAPRAPKRGPVAVAEDPLEGTDLADDQVLELTDALPGETETTDEAPAAQEPVMTAAPAKPESKPAKAAPPKPRAAAPNAPSTVISDASAQAARDSLVNLSRMLVVPEEEESPSNTLEGLVREMLRPMLKDWLDANLPGMVETMVKREIDRITGRV